MQPPWMLVDYCTKGSYPTERAGSSTEDQQTNKLKGLMSPVSPSHLPALTLRQTSRHHDPCPSLCLRGGGGDNQPSWGATPGRMGIWEQRQLTLTSLPWLHEQSPRPGHAGAIFIFTDCDWHTNHCSELTLVWGKKTSIHSFSDKTEALRGDLLELFTSYYQFENLAMPSLCNLSPIWTILHHLKTFCIFYMWY